MKIFGFEFAPIFIPLERRIQTACVFQWALCFLCMGFGSLAVFIYLLFTEYYFIPLAYLMWYIYDFNTCEQGGRRLLWQMNNPVWKYFADYFPVKLIKTAELDPSKNYIVGYHPHGIMSAGAFANFATNATGFNQIFPNMHQYLCILTGQFRFPFFREYLMSSGCCAVSKNSLNWLLNQKEKGKFITIVVGGAVEAIEANPGKFKLKIKKRKGFIKIALQHGGSHLVIHLVKKYPEYFIVNYDKLNYCSSLKPLEHLCTKPNYKFIEGNICDPQTVYNALKKHNIDTILHLAAESHVDLSFENPLEFSMTNVYGSHVLINAAKDLNIELFFHMSTDEIYGGAHDEICYEESSFQPSNPYAATKAAAECIVMSYWRTYKLPVIIIRANNIYGPHQYPDKVVSRFISLLLKDEKCTIHGDGQKVRNFIYVSDIVNAIDILIHKGKHGEIYNIGSEFSISILELAKLLIKKIKNVTSEDDIAKYIEFVKDRVFNDNQYNINYAKILDFGWKTKEPWQTGIEKTIEWYRKHRINWSVEIDMED